MTTLEKIEAIRELIKEAKHNRVKTINKKIQRLITSIPRDEYLLYEETIYKLTNQVYEKPNIKKATKK